MVEQSYVKPRLFRFYDGDPLLWWERPLVALGLLRSALRDFKRAIKITPALRERCVEYAIRSGSKGEWEVERHADRLTKWIAHGEGQ